VTPSLAEARTLEALDTGGKRVEHTYRMAGIELSGELASVLENTKAYLGGED